MIDRTKLSPTSTEHGSLISLGHALAVYLGTNEGEPFGTGGALKRFGIDSSRDFVDMLSRVRRQIPFFFLPLFIKPRYILPCILIVYNQCCHTDNIHANSYWSIRFPNNCAHQSFLPTECRYRVL